MRCFIGKGVPYSRKVSYAYASMCNTVLLKTIYYPASITYTGLNT